MAETSSTRFHTVLPTRESAEASSVLISVGSQIGKAADATPPPLAVTALALITGGATVASPVCFDLALPRGSYTEQPPSTGISDAPLHRVTAYTDAGLG